MVPLRRARMPGSTALTVATVPINLFNLYFLTSWLPTVINGAGQSISRAAIATALFQFAGILGTLLFGRVADRFHPCAALGVLYVVGGVFIVLTGLSAASASLVLVTVACAGFCVVGAQNASISLQLPSQMGGVLTSVLLLTVVAALSVRHYRLVRRTPRSLRPVEG